MAVIGARHEAESAPAARPTGESSDIAGCPYAGCGRRHVQHWQTVTEAQAARREAGGWRVTHDTRRDRWVEQEVAGSCPARNPRKHRAEPNTEAGRTSRPPSVFLTQILNQIRTFASRNAATTRGPDPSAALLLRSTLAPSNRATWRGGWRDCLAASASLPFRRRPPRRFPSCRGPRGRGCGSGRRICR
jgi:hypothetical protein